MEGETPRVRADRSQVRAATVGAGPPLRLVLAVFVCTYSLVQVALALSLAGAGALLPVSLLILMLIGAGVFVGSLMDSTRGSQQFYLALSILPGLTVARLAFTAGPFSAFDPLFVYLLLAVTLLVYRQTTGARFTVREGASRRVVTSLLGGFILAGMFTALALRLGPLGSPAFTGPPWLGLAVVVPVAFLDELWFRGVLQSRIAAVSSAPAGWFAALVLFAAYGAPFGGWTVLGFRLALGFVFGLLATRRRNLPMVLTARVVLALALAALIPAAVGTSLIV